MFQQHRSAQSRPTVTRGIRDPSKLAVSYASLGSLVPDPSNPRLHSEKQLQQLERSIATFGFTVPILIDEKNRVLAGHGRLAAARRRGMDVVPVIRVSHLTDAQKRAYLIADNKLAMQASWDDALLAEQFAALAEVEIDFSLDVTGFELPEIDLIVQGASGTAQPDPDDVPMVPAPVVSRVGDVWQLGPHRIVCGSALDSATYSALMGADRATMIFTDPPWNVPVQGHVGGLGKRKHREFVQASGEMSDSEFAQFLRAAYVLMVRYSVDGSLHFVACDWRHVRTFLEAGDGLFAEFKNLCVWNKGTGAMGSHYRSQHELFLLFKVGTAAHINNVQLGRFGRTRTNVWDYPGMNSFARESEEGNLLDLHPSVKPVALVADALMDASHRGDIVLDPFLGSGSTLIAAERTGRIARGIDLDPGYIDVAIRRWQRKTHRAAIHVGLNVTFDELAEQEGYRG